MNQLINADPTDFKLIQSNNSFVMKNKILDFNETILLNQIKSKKSVIINNMD
jgi:hypothetical protein